MASYYDRTAAGIGGLALFSIFLGVLGTPFLWQTEVLFVGLLLSAAGLLAGLIGWFGLPAHRRTTGGFALLVGAAISTVTLILNIAVLASWMEQPMWSGWLF